MISWNLFVWFAVPALILWLAGAYWAIRERRIGAIGFTLSGTVVFAAFIVGLWIGLERPPLRSMGETRLWYSFFMPVAGLVTYLRWKYKWILSFSTLMALVFICINLFKPEIHNKALMPALQSPWFAPHVIVYMFSYAMMGASTLLAIAKLCGFNSHKLGGFRNIELEMIDNLTNTGLVFITFGMLLGALWAKEVWGHYWSWDPKETWAAATWLLYLSYIHWRYHCPQKVKPAMWLLVVAFVCLQMCWWGINYLPSAQGMSVHTYNLN